MSKTESFKARLISGGRITIEQSVRESLTIGEGDYVTYYVQEPDYKSVAEVKSLGRITINGRIRKALELEEGSEISVTIVQVLKSEVK